MQYIFLDGRLKGGHYDGVSGNIGVIKSRKGESGIVTTKALAFFAIRLALVLAGVTKREACGFLAKHLECDGAKPCPGLALFFGSPRSQ